MKTSGASPEKQGNGSSPWLFLIIAGIIIILILAFIILRPRPSNAATPSSSGSAPTSQQTSH